VDTELFVNLLLRLRADILRTAYEDRFDMGDYRCGYNDAREDVALMVDEYVDLAEDEKPLILMVRP
jgi:hypothetical protein